MKSAHLNHVFPDKARRHTRTFVLGPKLDFDPTGQSTFSDYLQRKGINAQWKILNRQRIVLPETVLLEHPATTKDPFFCASAVMGEPGQSIAYYQLYMLDSEFLSAAGDQLDDQALLSFLRNYPQGKQLKVERSFEAVAADKVVAEKLGVTSGQPTQLLDLKFITAEGRIVLLIRSFFRGDRLRYTL
ncbi:MAG: UTRA domain-containing protein [Pseudomonadales bacterium]